MQEYDGEKLTASGKETAGEEPVERVPGTGYGLQSQALYLPVSLYLPVLLSKIPDTNNLKESSLLWLTISAGSVHGKPALYQKLHGGGKQLT